MEILCWVDDHSRYTPLVAAHGHVTGPVASYHSAKPLNGMAFRPPHSPIFSLRAVLGLSRRRAGPLPEVEMPVRHPATLR